MNRVWLFVVLMLGLVAAADANVKVSVDRTKVYEGDSINLTVKVEGTNEYPGVNLGTLNELFTIVSGPTQSSNMRWVNGVMSSDVTVSWMLIPKRKGTLEIQPLTITSGGKTYRSNPISITVHERSSGARGNSGQAQIPEQDFFLEADVDKTQPYRGEQVTLTYTLYSRTGEITELKLLEDPRFKGFWFEDLYKPASYKISEVRRGGERMYAVTIRKVALFATQSGKITLEPIVARVGVRQRSSSNWFRDPFFSRSKSHTVSSNPIDLEILPLPANPDGINSASVGSWQLETKVSSHELAQDEALTLTIQITGRGHLQAVDVSEISFPQELEVFEPEINIAQDPLRDTIAGTKSIEYVLIPRVSGNITIPPVELSYFDVKARRWRTLRSQPIPLTVAENSRVQSTVQGLTKEEIRIMGEDIRFADQSDPRWQRTKAPVISGATYLLLALSILFLLLPSVVSVGQSHLAATESHRIARTASRESLKILTTGGEPAETYHNISLALNVFIDLKTGRRNQRSTQEILKQIRKHTDRPDIADRLKMILERGDAVRFAPVSEADTQNDLRTAESLIGEADNVWK